jgi:hypothetical protein
VVIFVSLTEKAYSAEDEYSDVTKNSDKKRNKTNYHFNMSFLVPFLLSEHLVTGFLQSSTVFDLEIIYFM